MITTVIGAYPKPSYLKLPDWFNAEGGTDTQYPTKDYHDAIKKWVAMLNLYFKKLLKK